MRILCIILDLGCTRFKPTKIIFYYIIILVRSAQLDKCLRDDGMLWNNYIYIVKYVL